MITSKQVRARWIKQWIKHPNWFYLQYSDDETDILYRSPQHPDYTKPDGYSLGYGIPWTVARKIGAFRMTQQLWNEIHG